jgi:restriction system protein
LLGFAVHLNAPGWSNDDRHSSFGYYKFPYGKYREVMGRRKKQDLAGELISSPWQVSAVVAVAAFIGVRWILPGVLPQGLVLAGLRPFFDPLSWIALCAFGFLALLAAIRTRIQTGKREGKLTRTREVKPSFHHPFAAEQAVSQPANWSLDALRTLEWKRFELLCARYYEAVGFRTETLDAGPDGGIDVKLFKIDPSRPLAVVQCKAWNTRQVGVKEIRELLGVMAHVKVSRGIFVTTGTYTKDALDFGAANPIQLLDGAAFEKKILELPAEKQDALRAFAFEGDYRSPTCASCGVKMVARDSKRGPFWGCTHYPRCKTTLPMRDSAA